MKEFKYLYRCLSVLVIVLMPIALYSEEPSQEDRFLGYSTKIIYYVDHDMPVEEALRLRLFIEKDMQTIPNMRVLSKTEVKRKGDFDVAPTDADRIVGLSFEFSQTSSIIANSDQEKDAYIVRKNIRKKVFLSLRIYDSVSNSVLFSSKSVFDLNALNLAEALNEILKVTGKNFQAPVVKEIAVTQSRQLWLAVLPVFGRPDKNYASVVGGLFGVKFEVGMKNYIPFSLYPFFSVSPYWGYVNAEEIRSYYSVPILCGVGIEKEFFSNHWIYMQGGCGIGYHIIEEETLYTQLFPEVNATIGYQYSFRADTRIAASLGYSIFFERNDTGSYLEFSLGISQRI